MGCRSIAAPRLSPELREKFDRQRYLFNRAIWYGDLEEVRRESGRMVKAWMALDRAAESAGALKLAPRVCEVPLAGGSVAAIVPTDCHAAFVNAEGREVAVYTLEEIGRLLSAHPHIVKAKEAFPGARVTAVRRSVEDPLNAVWDTAEPPDLG
jgi:hypothetical protein